MMLVVVFSDRLLRIMVMQLPLRVICLWYDNFLFMISIQHIAWAGNRYAIEFVGP